MRGLGDDAHPISSRYSLLCSRILPTSVVSPILAAVRKTWRKIWKVTHEDFIILDIFICLFTFVLGPSLNVNPSKVSNMHAFLSSSSHNMNECDGIVTLHYGESRKSIQLSGVLFDAAPFVGKFAACEFILTLTRLRNMQSFLGSIH